jgi:hypothetical protein
MAFTEAQLIAQIDPTGGGRTCTITRFQNCHGAVNTEVHIQGVLGPYAGRARWVAIPNTQTAAQAWATIKTALA